jgi:hypothetical protein
MGSSRAELPKARYIHVTQVITRARHFEEDSDRRNLQVDLHPFNLNRELPGHEIYETASGITTMSQLPIRFHQVHVHSLAEKKRMAF